MIKFIFFFGAIIYLMSKFSTQIFRFAVWLLGKQVEKEMEQRQAKSQGFNVKNMGDVKIFYQDTRPPHTQKNAQTGNYVEYEEVKE